MTFKIPHGYVETKMDTQSDEVKIAGHPVSVKDIVIWHVFMGQSVQEIAASHNLALSNVYAAMAYYHDHKQEIDAKIDIQVLRGSLREQRAPEKNKTPSVEEKEQVPILTQSALVIGWVFQVFLALSLVTAVLFGVRFGVSFVFQKLGAGSVADAAGEFASSLAVFFGWFIVWQVWKRRREGDSRVKGFFALPGFFPIVLVWFVGLPLLRLVLQVLSVGKDVVFYVEIAVMLFLVACVAFYEQRKTRETNCP